MQQLVLTCPRCHARTIYHDRLADLAAQIVAAERRVPAAAVDLNYLALPLPPLAHVCDQPHRDTSRTWWRERR